MFLHDLVNPIIARYDDAYSRYNMLKDMIKGVLRDPNYMEVCHEDINQYEDEAA